MLRLSIVLVLFSFCMVCAESAFAKGERYGISAQYFNINSVEFDEGSTEETNTIKFGFAHTRPIDENNNRWRWLFNLNFLSTEIPAQSNSGSKSADVYGLYQEVQSLQFRVMPQYAVADWGWVTPLLGLGISTSYSQYSERWRVDPDGVKYGDQLEDIEAFEYGLVASVGTVIKLGSNPNAHLQLVPEILYNHSFNNGLSGIEFSLTLLF
ncbi:hypothetical protein [Moritella viscosa]|uniref:Uncharacterized protein n=1 Tax=Moritella viscosa TaxID=80854 RepID=A0A090IF41_9GAMM|nr:hypothetical protein [Moritella viscosa]CED60741.1 putative type VI secretion system, exported protein [Moritella viscosa]SGY96666.1 Putative uncharacterized protein [Moritella viscosa]SGZ02975.1 Putative uncharacterized protein [Moritella viscosa]SGZ09424.1 Putative uncharacterized protein [Moritella viscosa]SGZ15803.1 Putative uncharacterized protein [Moritella viscosa]